MKTCSKCNEAKELSEFFIQSKLTGRMHAECKDCYRAHRKIYYAEHYKKYGDHYRERATLRRRALKTIMRKKMLEYLSDKSCVMCGENDIRTLEFDHLDPTQKSFSIARGLNNGPGWHAILLEIKKCRILCSNCHKKHTVSQQNWYKTISE
jgi:hypothetical protein